MDERIMQGLQAFIDNKDDKQKTEMAKLFGNNTPVYEFADFYQRCANDLYKVSGAKMFEFCGNNDFTSTEFAAYKKGISDIMNIFIACWNEREELQRSSSGPDSSESDHAL